MTSRKEFLGAGALAALVPVGAPAASASPSPEPSPAPTIAPLHFDLAAFDGACARPAAHRQMFASIRVGDGEVLDAIQNTLQAYASIGIAESAVATAAVLYHGAAIALAFDDGVWKDLLVPAIAQAPDDIKKDLDAYKNATGNPFRQRKNPKAPSIENLVARGTAFYVCNNAAKGFAFLLAKLEKSAPQDVYDRLVKGLLPGATLVPAGVWAVGALQERRFTYLQTSL